MRTYKITFTNRKGRMQTAEAADGNLFETIREMMLDYWEAKRIVQDMRDVTGEYTQEYGNGSSILITLTERKKTHQ